MRTVVVFEEAQAVVHTRAMRPCVRQKHIHKYSSQLFVGTITRWHTSAEVLQYHVWSAVTSCAGVGKDLCRFSRHQHGDACGRRLPS